MRANDEVARILTFDQLAALDDRGYRIADKAAALTEAEADELLDLVRDCRRTARVRERAAASPGAGEFAQADQADEDAYSALVRWVHARTRFNSYAERGQ